VLLAIGVIHLSANGGPRNVVASEASVRPGNYEAAVGKAGDGRIKLRPARQSSS
jgi:hypothetical protein